MAASFIAAGVMLASTVEAGGRPPETEVVGTLTAEGGAPFSLADAERIKAGETQFNQTCAAYCHGKDPVLFVGRTGLDETYVFETIRDGGAGGQSPMPAWGEVFSAEEIWELVAYIKSIGEW